MHTAAVYILIVGILAQFACVGCGTWLAIRVHKICWVAAITYSVMLVQHLAVIFNLTRITSYTYLIDAVILPSIFSFMLAVFMVNIVLIKIELRKKFTNLEKRAADVTRRVHSEG